MDAMFTAEEHFRRGRELLEAGQEGSALEHFRAAHQLQRGNATYRSYYGLCVGLVERRFNKALELCGSAVKEAFFHPELYHNLARVHLAFGFKAEGLRYLKRGLLIDPGSRVIREELHRLGVRQEPVLRFLPRRHLLNRWLGRLRARFGGPPVETASAEAG
jgi:tetratricopeptide (TPR) repeat protein